MSIKTTRPQQAVPMAEVAPLLATGASAWANPATWTEFMVTTAPTVIAGVVVPTAAAEETFNNFHLEAAIGIGEESAEIEIGAFPYFGPNSGVGGPSNSPQPQYPIGVIPADTRVSVRVRANQVQNIPLALLYYESYDGDYADIDVRTLGGLPQSADMVSITPSATPWAASPWAVLSESLEVDTDVIALMMTQPVPDLDLRWELGKGPDGFETHLTTFPSASRVAALGRAWFAELPGPYPLNAGDRVVIRLRKNGTSTTVHAAALVVFRYAAAAADEGGVIGPLLWITMSFRPPAV